MISTHCPKYKEVELSETVPVPNVPRLSRLKTTKDSNQSSCPQGQCVYNFKLLFNKMLITPAAVKQWNIKRQSKLNSFFFLTLSSDPQILKK